MKKLILAAPILVLAACQTTTEDTASAPAAAVVNGEINGTYDPSQFTIAQIQEQARAQCASGAINHYVEGPGSNGMMVYTARCI